MNKKKFTREQENLIRELYTTGQYTQAELAKKYGCTVSTINRYINSGQKAKIGKKISTKARTEMIRDHILECFDNDIQAVIDTIKANIFGNCSIKTACEEVVQGGCLLVYYSQVNDFLERIGVDLSINDESNWSMYKKLCVNRLEKIYKEVDEDE